jgi:predicted ester cyclase
VFRRRRHKRTGRQALIIVAGLTAAIASVVVLRRLLKKGVSVTDLKEIARRLSEEPWAGDFDIIDEYVTPEYVNHDPSEPEPILGPAGFKAQIEKYRAAFADAKITVDAQFAAGNMVATRWTARGTHTGEIAGLAPTGKQATVAGITLSRFENGLLVEDHSNWDTLGMLIQLGAIPAPAQA